MNHTHDDNRLTFGCDACINQVKKDQAEAERWGDPHHIRRFEIDIDFDISHQPRTTIWWEAPADLTVDEANERFVADIDEIAFELIHEHVTSRVSKIRLLADTQENTA